MSALHIAEAFCALVAFVLADGSLWRRRLDDRDRSHLVDAALAEDRAVAALDAIWEMPTREHP